MQQLTKIASDIIDFINGTAVPLVFAIAFIVFLIGVFRYFIYGGANEESRKSGRQLIIYSIIGFAVMIVVWGLVNLIVGTFGFDTNTRPDLPTFAAPSNNGVAGNANSVGTPPSTGGTLISPETQQFLDQQSQAELHGSPQPSPDQSQDPNPYDSIGPGI